MSVLAALVKRFEVDVDSEVPKMLVSGERVEWLSKSSTIPGATFIKSL